MFMPNRGRPLFHGCKQHRSTAETVLRKASSGRDCGNDRYSRKLRCFHCSTDRSRPKMLRAAITETHYYAEFGRCPDICTDAASTSPSADCTLHDGSHNHGRNNHGSPPNDLRGTFPPPRRVALPVSSARLETIWRPIAGHRIGSAINNEDGKSGLRPCRLHSSAWDLRGIYLLGDLTSGKCRPKASDRHAALCLVSTGDVSVLPPTRY